MRILVLSDSHRHVERLALAVDLAAPDAILHLGDHIGDARKLRAMYPDVEFYMVKGNCDVHAEGETELLLTLEGAKILMAHGHAYNVKNGLAAFSFRAREAGADIALYGHTHKAMVERAHGIWFMNPGQMERHDAIRASYGIVTVDGTVDGTADGTVDGGGIRMELKELP